MLESSQYSPTGSVRASTSDPTTEWYLKSEPITTAIEFFENPSHLNKYHHKTCPTLQCVLVVRIIPRQGVF